MTHATSLAVASVMLVGCGSSRAAPDGAPGPADDADAPDAAMMMGLPPPPALGVQIDRAGRPGISAMLIAVFSAPAVQTAAREVYGGAPDPAAWQTTMLPTGLAIKDELAANLAVFDVIDSPTPATGCGNPLIYTKPMNAASYQRAAALFADDQLYVDTSLPTCTVYLALEIEDASATIPHTTCGGRTLTHDATDVTYSVLASGVDGLNQASGFTPNIHGSLTAHADITDSFPFLGPPHPP
jgi:hypothetical protein